MQIGIHSGARRQALPRMGGFFLPRQNSTWRGRAPNSPFPANIKPGKERRRQRLAGPKQGRPVRAAATLQRRAKSDWAGAEAATCRGRLLGAHS